MDILRIDTKDLGPVYIRSDALFILGRVSEEVTNMGVVFPGVRAMDIEVNGDIDEFAAMLETNGGFRIRRVN